MPLFWRRIRFFVSGFFRSMVVCVSFLSLETARVCLNMIRTSMACCVMLLYGSYQAREEAELFSYQAAKFHPSEVISHTEHGVIRY